MCGIRNITGVAPGLAGTLFPWHDEASGSRGIPHRCWSGRIARNGIVRELRRGSLNSERWSPAVTFPRRRISWFCRRRPPRGPLRDHDNPHNLALRGHPLCSMWSSNAVFSPMRYKFPRDRFCRSPLPRTWNLRRKLQWPQVHWWIGRSYQQPAG